jgi:hypothetical protein
MIEQLLSFWPYAIGYGFALVVGQIFIGKIEECMYTELGIPNRERAWHSKVLGSIERILFIASFQVGIPQFIAIWVGLKTAGGWKHWTEEIWIHKDANGKEIEILGRHTFNIFLVAQALSIGFSTVGWKLIEWLTHYAWAEAIAAGVAALIGATVLWLIVCSNSKKPPPVCDSERSVR